MWGVGAVVVVEMGCTKRRTEPRVSIVRVVSGARTRRGETGGYTQRDVPKLPQDDPLYCSLHKCGDPSATVPRLQPLLQNLLLQDLLLQNLPL